MKRIFFSLLALMLGMSVGAFAQPEASDKWVITPVPSMKGVLGMLDINFPADVERNILIYQQADNKFLRSVSRNDKIYTIAPGEYRFTLTNVPVENVPIKKGHETRLKARFLDIVSEGDWHLYDETKKKAYTSGNKPKKLLLPVGRYQIKLGGQFYPVIIKDGETVEDYTPAKVTDKTPEKGRLEDNTDPVDESIIERVLHSDESKWWVITPIKAMSALNPGKGKLSIIIPKDTAGQVNDYPNPPIPVQIPVYIKRNIKIGMSDSIYGATTPIGLPKDLPAKPDGYPISLNDVMFSVPVKSNRETRIKAGFLIIKEINQYDQARFWMLKVSGGITIQSGAGNYIIALPPGEYVLIKTTGIAAANITYKVTIKDGEWVYNGVRQ